MTGRQLAREQRERELDVRLLCGAVPPGGKKHPRKPHESCDLCFVCRFQQAKWGGPWVFQATQMHILAAADTAAGF